MSLSSSMSLSVWRSIWSGRRRIDWQHHGLPPLVTVGAGPAYDAMVNHAELKDENPPSRRRSGTPSRTSSFSPQPGRSTRNLQTGLSAFPAARRTFAEMGLIKKPGIAAGSISFNHIKP